MTDQSAPISDPAENFSFSKMLPTLVFDVALPIAIFNVLTLSGVSTLWALLAGGLSPAINNLRIWAKSRRVEPLGIIVMTFLVFGTVISVISGSIFFAVIKDSFLTATFGLMCLFSLFAERPLMFYVSRQFVAGDDPVRVEWWNGLWQHYEFRYSQRLVTAVWGIIYLLEALLCVGLALVLSPEQMVVISPVMAFAVMIVLIVWTHRYMVALRDREAATEEVIE